MFDWTVIAAVSASVAVMLGRFSGGAPIRRVTAAETRRHGGTDGLPRIGIAAVMAGVCASLRAGSGVTGAFEEQAGCRFAVPEPTVCRLRAMLAARALPKETPAQINRVAKDLAAACGIGAVMGCPMERCLQTVLADYRRSRLLEDLRAQSYAAPQATVRLLSVLPAVTVMLGELLGARPLRFLFGSTAGAVCLLLGLCWYVAGMMWTRRMLRDMSG